MISIQTNLSSLVTQNNLTTNTNKLNQAIERMSTGYKINHASDNAANYSISKNINVQLSACDVAADNISMGIDLLSTAQDTIAGMQERASRIHALITQARNGTYGATSLSAMTSEARAIAAEINRLYSNTEYNGKKLLEIPLPEWAEEVKANAGVNAGVNANGISLEDAAAANNGFIDTVVCDTPQVIVTDPSQLAAEIASSKTKIGIGNAETLEELAKLVNGTSTYAAGAKNCSGKTIVLTEDVDLSAICKANTDSDGNGGWTPIGNSSKQFQGTFNGNGHKVTGLYIKRTGTDYQGLFGSATGELKNIGLDNATVTGRDNTGGLIGCANGAITNSYATGNVTGRNFTGGLAGIAYGNTTNSYTKGYVTGSGYRIGGLLGQSNGNVLRCYTTGAVTGQGEKVGGLVGWAYRAIDNSYATSNVTGGKNTGGLAGYADSGITNSYATGQVTGNNNYTGGLVGRAVNISNSYATGNVSGNGYSTGGLAGGASGAITNSYATGNVSGNGYSTGGLAGYANSSITNSYATGSVSGADYTGGLVGYAKYAISNSYATGNVSGNDWVGGLFGRLSQTSGTYTNNQILSAGKVSGKTKVGSLIGGIENTSNGSNFSTITITNASARQGIDMIGFEGKSDGTAYTSGQMDGWLENITELRLDTTLQVGINGDESSQIKVDTSMSINLSISDLTSDSAYNSITSFLNQLSQKATEIGAAQNRLDSALESNLVKMDNLTSSLSTIRDADIGKLSSDYIRHQILQQACATLMATANQNPSIALQLL